QNLDSLVNGENWALYTTAQPSGLDTVIHNTNVLAGSAYYTPDDNKFYMNLPTHVNVGVDFNVYRDFYLNMNAFIGFQMNKNAHKVRFPTAITFTPRYDFAWAGLAFPFSYNKVLGFRVGAGLRAGPIVIGTSDLKWLFAPGKNMKVRGLDLYAALRVPILYSHPRDQDLDKVSDKLDICIATPGVWEFKGCPDTDMDGIQDSEDACPTEAGPKEFNGCPDRDGDKIIDLKDDCPDDPGLAEFNGCPDRDGDKIIDKNDDCPDVPGIELFKGCPDTDGDGLKDSDDLCPEHPGPLVNQGCPDTDNDGIFDYLDGCPEEAGPEENNGCPWPDTDGDGLLDKDDKCPYNAGPVANQGCPYIDTDGDGVLDKDDDCVNVPGPVENKGCPKIDEEIIKRAFNDLEFQSAKAIIKDHSLPSLTDLATYMVDNPEFKITIAGHTDSDGGAQANLILSKKRAEAVRDFLESQGVAATRSIVKWFGETQPIASNDTAEGKQKNRRVEMKIIFE
ncbi:OmpA family protein, partial [bacterium AH-315-B15]|nr:OmpA family protein [bacterium AH-315-B15]